MKLLIIAIWTLLLLTPNAKASESTDFLTLPAHQFVFDIHSLPTVTLSFSRSDWVRLNQSTRDSADEVVANFTYTTDNQTIDVQQIAVKVSGNTSFVVPEPYEGSYQQAHFSLDFDEFIDQQQFSGLSKLRLKRFHNDSTFVREPLSNQIMLNFGLWTAHSSTYCRLVIHVENRDPIYFGIYRLNESINRKEYLDKRFGTDNDNGHLWQGNHKSTGPAFFANVNPNWDGIGLDDNVSFEYKGKAEHFSVAKNQLIDIAQQLTQLEGEAFEIFIEQHVNIPLFLKFLAAEATLGHWDGFWGNGNNYHFYIDENEILHFIPYDTDNTLGTSLFTDVGTQNPFEFAARSAPPLVSKILAIAEYRAEFKSNIKALISEANLMTETYALGWIQTVHQLIESELTNDTGDNQIIDDLPAQWGNQGDYRLFDFGSGRNWYQIRRQAILKYVNLDDHLYPSMYYRGVTNRWGTTPMVEVANNLWQVTINSDETINSEGEPRFKFDVYGNWQTNFGDNNSDGIVEQDGADILLNDGYGDYLIQLNAYTGKYTVNRLDKINQLPTAEAGPDITTTIGSVVTLDASGSFDSDGTIVDYQWSIGTSGAVTDVQFVQAGVFEITLTITDDKGETATDTITIEVVELMTERVKSGSSAPFGILLLVSLVVFRATRFRQFVSR